MRRDRGPARLVAFRRPGRFSPRLDVRQVEAHDVDAALRHRRGEAAERRGLHGAAGAVGEGEERVAVRLVPRGADRAALPRDALLLHGADALLRHAAMLPSLAAAPPRRCSAIATATDTNAVTTPARNGAAGPRRV